MMIGQVAFVKLRPACQISLLCSTVAPRACIALQILALNCLISAYSLSVLYLEGHKNGSRQMIALGMLLAVASITSSRSKSLDKLSSVRPIASFFHPALFFSVLGQV